MMERNGNKQVNQGTKMKSLIKLLAFLAPFSLCAQPGVYKTELDFGLLAYLDSAGLYEKGWVHKRGDNYTIVIPSKVTWENPDGLDFYLVRDNTLVWRGYDVVAIQKGDTTFTPILPQEIVVDEYRVSGIKPGELKRHRPRRTIKGNQVSLNAKGMLFTNAKRNKAAQKIKKEKKR